MSAKSRYSYRITKGGLLFGTMTAAIYVGAYNTDINLLILICSTMISVLLASLVLPNFGLLGLSCRRTLPAEAYANEPFRVSVRVRNPRASKSRSLTALDAVSLGRRVLMRPRAWLEVVEGQSEASMDYLALLPRRGVYACGGLSLRTGFPFGLAAGVRRYLNSSQELLVFPQRGRLLRNLSLVLNRTRSLVGASARRAVGEEEFRSLREFVPGDNPKRIHWKTTARLGKPHVREMEWARESSLLIVVDTQAEEGDTQGEERLDSALSFAAEVARRVAAEGGVVRFAAYGPQLVVVDGVSEPREMRRLLAALARLRPAPGRSLGQLAAEREVGFHAAGRRLAVFLSPAAESAFRRGAKDSAYVRSFVVGSGEFNATFQPIARPAPEGIFRPEPRRARRGARR